MNVSRHCSSVLGMPFLRSSYDDAPPPETFPDVFHGTDEDREGGGGLEAASVQTLRVAFAGRKE